MSQRKLSSRRVTLSVATAAFAPMAVALVVASFFVFHAFRTADRSQSIQNMGSVLGMNSQSLKHIVDMESRLRGYLLTQDPIFLESYRRAESHVLPSLDELEEATESDAALARIVSIRTQFQNWRERVEGLREMRENGGRYNDPELNLGAKRLMDSIRNEYRAVRELEVEHLRKEQKAAHQATQRVLLLGVSISLLLGGLLSWWLFRRLSLQYDRVSQERQRADEALARLQAIADAAPVAIVYMDRDQHFAFSNKYYRERYGRVNLEGRTIAEVVGAEAYKKLKPHLDKAFGGEVAVFETRIEREGLTPIEVSALYAPSFNARGEVEGIVAISEDITQKKEFESQLGRSRENLEFALQSGRMGTWDLDLETGGLSCSPEMLDLWGISPAEFAGERDALQSRVHPEDLQKMKDAIEHTITHGGIYELSFRIFPRPGKTRWVLSRGRCSYDARRDKPGRFSGVAYDITESKLAERQLQESKEIAEKASLAKTQFLANMSHEIRTPVGAIIGFIEMLKKEDHSPADEAHFMSIIERNSQNLLRLIDDILDLSKVEAGKVAFERSDFSFPTFLRDLSSVMKLKAMEKSIGFNLEVRGRIPEIIHSDQLRLRQILSNLVGNAIKFTEQGQVDLTVEATGEILKFTVTDTGIGISPENQGRIFKSFGQADASMTRRFGGSGLGLILAKRLAEALGGDVILARSKGGEGSTFVATLRAEPAVGGAWVDFTDTHLAGEGAARRGENRGRLEGLNVLLVEDAPDNQLLIGTYLRNTGARVEMADDGISGVKKAMGSKPDVILMDIQMPELDGHGATRRLRAAGFAKPIIALTAHAMREERDRCFESGCNDYLTKPIQRDRLIEVLSRYLPK